ncbi:Beta-glucosidase [Methylocella tundrae]|uniref:beta-glucosidase n=1 Tax=Methylocella tundrae TaxID=227605 RepID=A0A8B6M7R1_METTU|nr:glycoside hydrolase family 3 N-terminal domain-containing protein [Methylocella tundrae]VTZ50847.1 Beta-glucosidase [Methylocella tundrae]
MTLEEKVGQLSMAAGGYAVTGPLLGGDVTADIRAGRVGSLLNLWGAEVISAVQKMAIEETRLGIPLLVGFDVLHGHRTIFPIPLAEAAAFDAALWAATARASAAEAAQDGISLVFAPMLDVARDPRWGRIAEGAGEDPLVAAEFGKAKVFGFQGANLEEPGAVAATVKHFCAYGAALAGRDYASVDISERTLHEAYLPPFAATVAAGCAAVMPAFMDLAGIPMTAHRPLLRGWLRGKQRFDGVIISDYNALAELMRHGVAADLVDAAALALIAGVDIDMMSGAYHKGLPRAVAEGRVSMEEIDASVRRVLTLKQRLGLFDAACRQRKVETPSPAPGPLAREAARRAIVLLTNKGALPLPSSLEKISVIGPLADARREMDGPWAAAGDREKPVAILEGLAATLPDVEIRFAAGVGIEGEDDSGIIGALELCRDADVIVLCVGEAAAMSGEAASRADLGLPGRQTELAKAALDLGKPVVALLSSGRPLTVPWLFERAAAVLATWFLGVEAGNAIADVLTGRFNPVGRLPVTWPRAVGQIPIFLGPRPTGRPFAPNDSYTSKYLDVSVRPQFYFGHGLSYSCFAISDLRAKSQSFRFDETVEFTAEIVNEGPQSGEATVFLFARDVLASIARPLLELKGFAKIALCAGEKGLVYFSLAARELSFPGADSQPCFEPGAFEFSAGFSAEPEALVTIRLEALP